MAASVFRLLALAAVCCDLSVAYEREGVRLRGGGLGTTSTVSPDARTRVLDTSYLLSSPFPTNELVRVAGDESLGTVYSGDGVLAVDAGIGEPEYAAVDSSDNLYFGDSTYGVVRVVSATTGIISLFAGTFSAFGNTGDGGLATSAQIGNPFGITVDYLERLLIADSVNSVVRRVTLSGDNVISTVVGVSGSSTSGYSGDGGLATAAVLNQPSSVAVDTLNNIYVVDFGNRIIRKVTATTGIITSLFGVQGESVCSTTTLRSPMQVAIDSSNKIYIADYGCGTVMKIVGETGTIVAGVSGEAMYNGDGLAATASYFAAYGVAVDPAGDLIITDTHNQNVRKVTMSTGIMNVIAGIPKSSGYNGDNLAPTASQLSSPFSSVVTSNGNLLIADKFNYIIRGFSLGSSFTTIPTQAPTAVPTDAPGSHLGQLVDLASYLDSSHPQASFIAGVSTTGSTFDSVFYVSTTTTCAIYQVSYASVYTLVAGVPGTCATSTSSDPLTATLKNPKFVQISSNGNFVYFLENSNTIRLVRDGVLSTYFYSAALACLYCEILGLALDSSDNVYFSYSYLPRPGINNENTIYLVKNGAAQAVTPAFSNAYIESFSIDSSNNAYFLDSVTYKVTTIPLVYSGSLIGSSSAISGITGGSPVSIAVDSINDLLYLADDVGAVVRQYNLATGVYDVVAGTGVAGYSGNNLVATVSELKYPEYAIVGPHGNVFVLDNRGTQIRKLVISDA